MTAPSSCVQVKLLGEEGGADVWVRDRWGKTAYDEARRVGATAVAEYLKQVMDRCCALSIATLRVCRVEERRQGCPSEHILQRSAPRQLFHVPSQMVIRKLLRAGCRKNEGP